MKLSTGMSVFTYDDQKVGSIKRLVLSPKSHEVTHLVIERGFLFTEEKLLPVDWVEKQDGDRLILQADNVAFDSLPLYDDQQYLPAELAEDIGVVNSPVYYYGMPGFVPPYMPIVPVTPDVEPRYAVPDGEDIPEGTVVLKTGAEVFTRDNQSVGRLEQVFVTERGQVTHFVLSSGFLFSTRKVIPSAWIDTIHEDRVTLMVTRDYLEGVPDYEQMGL